MVSNTEYDVCPICFEVMDGNKDTKILQCRHKYHVTCILGWFIRCGSCPMCRSIVPYHEIINNDLSLDLIDELMLSEEFILFAEAYDFSDNVRRRYMETVFNKHRGNVILAFSKYQSLDPQFIIDYIDVLDIKSIYKRQCELRLKKCVVDRLRKKI